MPVTDEELLRIAGGARPASAAPPPAPKAKPAVSDDELQQIARGRRPSQGRDLRGRFLPLEPAPGVDLSLAPSARPHYDRLQQALSKLGVRGRVTSARRPSATPSAHPSGRAVDIVVTGRPMPEVAERLRGLGFRAAFERKGQRNPSGSVATGDHIHITLAPAVGSIGELRARDEARLQQRPGIGELKARDEARLQQPRPGELRPPSVAERQRMEARARPSGTAQAVGRVGELAVSVLLPNAYDALRRAPQGSSDLEVALLKDLSVLRAAGYAARTAEGAWRLTRAGQAWAARLARTAPGLQRALMRILDPARIAGGVAGGVVGQAGVNVTTGRPVAENLPEAAVAGAAFEAGAGALREAASALRARPRRPAAPAEARPAAPLSQAPEARPEPAPRRASVRTAPEEPAVVSDDELLAIARRGGASRPAGARPAPESAAPAAVEPLAPPTPETAPEPSVLPEAAPAPAPPKRGRGRRAVPSPASEPSVLPESPSVAAEPPPAEPLPPAEVPPPGATPPPPAEGGASPARAPRRRRAAAPVEPAEGPMASSGPEREAGATVPEPPSVAPPQTAREAPPPTEPLPLRRTEPGPEPPPEPGPPSEGAEPPVEAPETPEVPPAPPGTPRATGIANRPQQAEVELGTIAPPQSGVTRSAREAHEAGRRAVEEGSVDPEALAREIARGERPFSWREAGVLLEGKRRLLRQVEAARQSLDAAIASQSPDVDRLRAEYDAAKSRLQEYVDNVQKGKTEWHNTGQALQAGTTLDEGSFAEVVAEAARAKGKPLSAREEERFARLAAEIRRLDAQTAELEAALRQAQAEEIVTSTSRAARRQQRREAIRQEREELLRELDQLVRETTSRLHSAPSAVYDGLRMGRIAGRLALNYAKELAVTVDEIVERTLSELRARGIQATREQIMEDIVALSAPRPSAAERSELQRRLAELRRAARREQALLAEIDRLRRGEKSAKTPRERRALTQRIAELEAERARLLAEARAAARQERAAARRERTTERLRAEIEALERGEPVPQRRAGERPADPEIEALRQRRAELREERRLSDLIRDLERQLETGDLRRPTPRERQISERIADLRARRSLLAAEVRSRIDAMRPLSPGALLAEAAGAMKSLTASTDLSAPGRQGWLLGVGNPDLVPRAFAAQLRALASPVAAQRIQAEILERPTAHLYRRAGLYLAPLDGDATRAEEQFLGRLLRVRLPIDPVAASERAYTVYLNRLRADVFDRMLRALGPTPDDAALKAVAHYINVATGRGGTGSQGFQQAANTLNHILFSPRFVFSRFQYALATPLIGPGGAMPARARLAIAQQYARTLGALGALVVLARAAGARVETDPRSSDYLKIRIGETRIDPLAGLQQGIVLAARLASGQTRGTDGRLRSLTEDRYGAPSRMDVVLRYARSKLAPFPGLLWTVAERRGPLSPQNVGTDFLGRPVSAGQLAADALAPMTLRDLWEGARQDGWTRDDWLGLLNVLGISTTTHEPRTPQRR